MVTTSVKMGPTLGDDIDIRNQICMLVATWSDGTPLGPSSFTEQDVVQLCIRLGQEHSKGMLQLFDTEAVLAFQHDTDMMAMKHHLRAAKVWWGELVMLHILPLKGGQVREYVARRGIHPSGAHMHMQGRGVGIQPLPSMPNPDKGLSEAQASTLQAELTRDVQDFDKCQLEDVLEALQTEMAWRERDVSLLGSLWGNPRGPGHGSEAVTDDGEVDPRR